MAITAFATPTAKTVKPLYCVFPITSSTGKSAVDKRK